MDEHPCPTPPPSAEQPPAPPQLLLHVQRVGEGGVSLDVQQQHGQQAGSGGGEQLGVSPDDSFDAQPELTCAERQANSAPPLLRLTEAGWLPDLSDKLPATDAALEHSVCAWRLAGAGMHGTSRRFVPPPQPSASEALLAGVAFMPVSAPLYYFRLHFDLFVGEREGGAARGAASSADAEGGFWVCYSDLGPENVAAVVGGYVDAGAPSGSGAGMCIGMRVAAEPTRRVVTVSHRGTVVRSVAPLSLRTHAWLTVTIDVTEAGCAVRHNGKVVLERVPLDGWSPAPHWRLALIAVTRKVPGDAYWVDNLRVDSALLRDYSAVPLEVSLNGQDFTSSGLTFGYHPAVIVSSLTPPGGPLSGGTSVVVSGVHMGDGDAYRCRFGSENLTVVASYDRAFGVVRCVSPVATAAFGSAGGDIPFGLSLNAQDFSTFGPAFRCAGLIALA